jgi:predicted RNA-binding protein YlqC (UPF0109 family)
MADLDQEFVEYVVKALVSNPEAVQVKRSVDDMGVLLELSVDAEDMGKVIGRGGATAKSIRTLLRVLGMKEDARINLKIIEPDGSVAPDSDGEVEAEQQPEPAAAPEPDLRAQTQEELKDIADLEI